MKKELLILFSAIFLIVGLIGFSLSPIYYDTKISNFQDSLTNYEYHRYLYQQNMDDAMNWWRNSQSSRNHVELLIELNVKKNTIIERTNEYIEECKFTLNSTVMCQYVAKGILNTDIKEINKRWNNITDAKEFFKLYKDNSRIAQYEMNRLEKKIIFKNNQIDTLDLHKSNLWVFSLMLQVFGMLLGTIYSYKKSLN